MNAQCPFPQVRRRADTAWPFAAAYNPPHIPSRHTHTEQPHALAQSLSAPGIMRRTISKCARVENEPKMGATFKRSPPKPWRRRMQLVGASSTHKLAHDFIAASLEGATQRRDALRPSALTYRARIAMYARAAVWCVAQEDWIGQKNTSPRQRMPRACGENRAMFC